CFKRAPRHQCWGWTRLDHVAQHLGRRLARAETADCLEPSERRARYAHAPGSGALAALELLNGAHFVLAVFPHAFLYGRRQPLPISQHGAPLSLRKPDGASEKL